MEFMRKKKFRHYILAYIGPFRALSGSRTVVPKLLGAGPVARCWSSVWTRAVYMRHIYFERNMGAR
jgi:hypothetical protein